MGTPSNEQPMDDIKLLVQPSLKYTEIIHEYCTLASQRSLTQLQADRLDRILHDAQFDPWLDFLIDEADHILAHQLGLIKEPFIQYQLQELSKSLDRSWFERMVQEIQQRDYSKKIQKYLQDEGLYDGAIDGYIGPRTQNAIKQLKLKRGCPSDAQIADCLELSNWLPR